jgi:cysteine synthase
VSIGVNLLDFIGNTPLIKIGKIKAKFEALNPSGSIKDRMALFMIQKAEEQGKLKKGNEILEVTTGNTGISFAMISAIKKYKFTAVMPESMSEERKKLMQLFGAKLILTPAKKDICGAIQKYNELSKKTNAWLPKQFENPDNFLAYKNGLAQEIINETKIDAFVAGAGTGGTLIGVAKALKEINSKAKIIAVEPYESAVLSGKKPGTHFIQGIGEGFIPPIIQKNKNLIDEVIAIKSSEALKKSNELAKTHGLMVGISSGANILASMKLKKKYKNIVTVLPDRGERYFSLNRL